MTRVLLALLFSVRAVSAAPPERTVAVTFDDLPGASLTGPDVATLRANTQKLLAGFKEHGVPVAAFVNEGKLVVEGETAADAEARRAVLKMWTDAGHELGNHTYSHRSLNRTPLEEFQKDVVRGEPVTRALMEARGGRLRYFRHPFLQVGLELEKRRAFESFLEERGYTIAPVTIDNDEWVFAAIYADAVQKGDRAQADRIADAYVAYMDVVFAFVEDLSRRVVGREIPQVLLVHANALNADHFPRIARALKARRYRFATLEEALKDEAYARPDTYVGAWGLSWLHHWEVTDGGKRTPSPDPPKWVTEAYAALEARRRPAPSPSP
jgi:peptidoglycan/xylan/chitin deacetylase (PgdA/CDA1 family)